MNDYLLLRNSTCLTGKLLAKQLGIKHYFNPRSNPPLIRWGNSSGYYDEDTEYNNREDIIVASHKVNMFNVLNNVIPLLEYKRNSPPKKYPVFVRTLLQSSKGRGIIICNNEEEFYPYSNYYYTEYEPFTREFRVHVIKGNIVKVMEKVSDNTIKTSDTSTYRRIDSNKLHDGKLLFTSVEKLYSTFPIGFCGIDFGYSPEKGFVFIECNSAPSLNSLTLELYATTLKDLI